MEQENIIIDNRNSSDNEKITELISSANSKQGVNPSHFLEFMKTAVLSKPWLEFKLSFSDWITNEKYENGIGYDLNTFMKLLHLEHNREKIDNDLHVELQEMRLSVAKLLKNRTLITKANNEKKLREKHPEIYIKYRNGEITLSGALKEIGALKPLGSYSIIVDSAVNSLKKNFKQPDLNIIADKITNDIILDLRITDKDIVTEIDKDIVYKYIKNDMSENEIIELLSSLLSENNRTYKVFLK
jgi:hypothetical protein